MNENSTTTPPTPPPTPPPSPHQPSAARRRLTRSSVDKMIGGVAGGLAGHLDVDTSLVRLAFVALAMFGGSGLLLYLLAWIIVPQDITISTGPGSVTPVPRPSQALATP